jgi:hypothetical protein
VPDITLADVITGGAMMVAGHMLILVAMLAVMLRRRATTATAVPRGQRQAFAVSGPVENRTIPDMINFCPLSTPITARRALKNVLQSRRVYQSSWRWFLLQSPV